MTPKEKAEELVKRFSGDYTLKVEETTDQWPMVQTDTIALSFSINGKKIASDCVDEIIESVTTDYVHRQNKDYWILVKQELDAL